MRRTKLHPMQFFVPLLLSIVTLPPLAHANDLRLGRYFSDHMVLQRGKPSVIRGMGQAGADVRVSFANQQRTTEVDEAGNWEVDLGILEANAEGMNLTVTSGAETVALEDVVVGDVILFARQSSIDVTLGRDQAVEAMAKQLKASTTFRAITIRTVPAPRPQNDLDEKATAGWDRVDQKQALTMSAAAYILGRDLSQSSGATVGIIDLSLGNYFPIAWLSTETVLDPAYNVGPVDKRVEQMSAKLESFLTKEPYGKKKRLITENPLENPLYPSAGYNGTILPLKGLGLKGLIMQLGNDYPYIFYEQAKATGGMTDRDLMNSIYIKTYDLRKEGFRMEPAMLSRLPREWRTALGDEDLPMAFVPPPSSDLWPYAVHNREVREVQRRTAEEQSNVSLILPGMDCVPFSGQPRDERLLAERSLKWAKGALYDDKSTSHSGPVYERFTRDGAEVTLHFKKGTAKGLASSKGALDHFEVADAEAEYVPAKAAIEGETIRLSCDDVPRILHVRYNWIDKPDQGLVNSDGLPALPFRTEDASHRWLVRYNDNDLAMEYYTPADEWKNGSVTLINGQLERYGYRHFSGWLGPIGVKTGPFGPNMGVREVLEGSPADGKLLVGDVIYSANGKYLGEDEEMVMSAAITDSEARDGRLVLGVHRDGTNLDVELSLPVMGRYSATAPWDCQKTERIIENLENYVVGNGAPSGFLSTTKLFLLGAGSPEHQWLVRRNALSTKSMGDNNWEIGYSTIYLSEYYLSTGDKRVLPQIKSQCDILAEHQIKAPESRRDGGWYGRGSKKRGYPAMAHAGLSAMLGMALAKECGVEVDAAAFERGLAYLERKGATVGQIIYGDAFRPNPALIDPEQLLAGKLTTRNGKIAEAAVLYTILGDKRAAYINSQISTHAWYSTYDGHGGNFWNNLWTPLGAAAHNRESFIYFMKGHRWYRECNRKFDGSLIHGVSDKSGAGTGLALLVPRRRLRILGAPMSPFSPDAPAILTEALEAYDAKDYQQAEKLALALVAEAKTDKDTEPTVNKLAEEAKRMQAGIMADLSYMEQLTKEGRLHEANLVLSSLTPVVAEGDIQLVAIQELLRKGSPRENDQHRYEVALKGGSNGIDESQAKSAADLQRMRAERAAAAVDTRTWISFTPKEFIPAKTNKKPGLDQGPADKAAKWKFTVLEHRDNAPEDWAVSGFDDSAWIDTIHPVSWHLNHITLFRTIFKVEDRTSYDLLKFRSWVFRQQDMAIYLNGTLIGRVNNIEQKTGSIEKEFKKVALNALKDGENVLAIATRQNWRWGMLGMRVYNGGFDFMLNARIAEDEKAE